MSINLPKKFGWLLFILVLLATRFLNLDNTARFTRDESSDLARMHEYWQAKKITLVGPISNDNVKVFGSLTYYMLMPFAVIGNFNPASPAYGTAFWGVLTVLLLILVVRKINPSLTPVAAILLLVWYPLLESSRWAWNPHLMPFWFAAGILLVLYNRWFTVLTAGMAIGLATHNHYVAFVPGVIFLLVKSVLWIREKRWFLIPVLWFGFAVALLPFIIFDLRHPPGLFIAGYIGSRTPHLQTIASVADFFRLLWRNMSVAALTMARSETWSMILVGISAMLIGLDLANKRLKSLLWLIPPAGLVLAGVFLDGFETRYFMAGMIFYLMWLIQLRSGFSKITQLAIIGVVLITSLITSPLLLQKPQYPPSPRIIKAASDVIRGIIKDNPDVKNANITTDMSEDMDMLSLKYRDYLSIRGISFRAASEYDVSEHLFVISQEDEAALRTSESYPLLVFKKEKVRATHAIPDSNWKVYWFSY